MSKIYDVVAVTGTYEKDGEEKPVWKNCGAIFETAKGLAMKLDLIPVASDGWFKLFEPKPKKDEKPAQQPQPQDDFDDDIPF